MQKFPIALWMIASLAAPSISQGQNVLETAKTRVEVLGLKRWTVPMIQDSLARYAPQDSLTSHACAAILRGKLKFADAAASYFERDSAGRELIVVAIVEPQDSALVRYLSPAPDSLPGVPQYSAAIASFRDYNMDFQKLIQDSAFLVGRSAARKDDAAWIRLEPVRRLISREHNAAGRRRAMRVLARDRNPYNRIMAAAVLSGFPESDATWLALANEFRYPYGMVSGTASQILVTLARYAPRKVDWRPGLDGITAVMAGTNLFAQKPLIEILTRTKVSPTLAAPIMRAGSPFLLARVAASPQAGRYQATQLLEQLSGQSHGNDVNAWARWAETLR